MIISASRRTDIPAYYSDWFFNRVHDGYVITKNPFNANQKSKLLLDPNVVDCIVFWTKNPAPMLERLDELDEKNLLYYFQFTLTPYGRDIEPGLPEKKELIDTFKLLSQKIGKEKVIWRYDPMFLNKKYSIDWHREMFNAYAEQLSGYTNKVVISFLDVYDKNKKNLVDCMIHDMSIEEKQSLANTVATIASKFDLVVESCAEDINLQKFGIEYGRCIDDSLISDLCGCALSVKKDPNQREECGCIASTDIGIYNTCRHMCKYCYANFNEGAVMTNYNNHNPNAPLLIGDIFKEDKISVPKQKSLKSMYTKTIV